MRLVDDGLSDIATIRLVSGIGLSTSQTALLDSETPFIDTAAN